MTVLWFTGLSGAGKTTLAKAVRARLPSYSFILDGDDLREGLNQDLGFAEAHRLENVRRVAEVAKLMVKAGVLPIVALISPSRQGRALARGIIGQGFTEIFIHAPLAVCEERDPKGLYAKARRGEIRYFTGIDAPYEPPLAPELMIDTVCNSVEACADKVLGFYGLPSLRSRA
jgi:bifunctional enzyme CysN/CysC